VIVESIDVRGFGPIKRLSERFKHENCIVGQNGSGKTTLLSLMAGVAGTDKASILVAGEQIEHFAMTLREGDEVFEFETKGEFDPEAIEEFKEKLPKRLNFALTEWTETFPAHCVDPATARMKFRLYCDRHAQFGGSNAINEDFVYSPASRSATFVAGDGYRFAMSLFLNDSQEGVPVLYDNPSRHMDMHGKRLMTEMLCREERQLFYTTHAPEMVLHEAWQGKNPDQLLVEVPRRALK
jgi:ATPase subunit of ABC transporter with duplicated ATPase domains